MDDRAMTILEALATNLGTTTEYLWGILLHQAPVQATIDLLLCVALTSVSVVSVKFMWNQSRDSNEGEFWVIGAGLLSIICLLMVGLTIPSIINGYIHPEYWALRHVLGRL